MGPRTVPCGMPESTVTFSDASPSMTTCICLLDKKVLSHSCSDPVIP